MAQTPIDDLYYTSPEVARNMAYESKSDMWAIGCVIRELMILEKPFLGTNALDLLDTIKLVRPAAIPSADYGWDLRELSKWFLQKDVAYRPSALDMYSFLVREWKTETEKYTALIKPEDVPWASDVLMAKKGKLEWNTGVHLGMTAEEREAMPDKEDREEYAKLIDDKNTAKKDIPGSVSA
ncbi:kinase-like domain-containing protein [Baffinella frigidus]|nr:kinase-like domain-containing protein [Cryptophyta sp. CCMP2293]